MTTEKEARLAELEHCRDHEIGCECAACEEWRALTSPEYRASLGRRELWALIKTHGNTCECPACLEWAARWDLIERSIPNE